MERSTLLALVFCFGAFSMQAQVDPVAPADISGQECLLATPVATWSAIGADADQVKRIEAIQALCHTDCNAQAEDGKLDAATSKAIVKKHEDEVARILTAEQFAQWKAYCKGRPERM